jgi:putative ABC transport system substrate-binding protein
VQPRRQYDAAAVRVDRSERMKRRAWLANVAASGLACAAARTWPQSRPRAIGFLGPPVPDSDARGQFDELRAELRKLGWEEGPQLRYEARLPGPTQSRDVARSRLAALARELVAANVDVIVAYGDGGAAAAKEATATIPIVFLADEPVESGLVSSLAQPGGNLTGVTFHIALLTAKRMQLLKQTIPGVARLAYLSANSAEGDANARAAARTLGLELQLVAIRQAADLDAAIATRGGIDAWVVEDYFLFSSHVARIVELIARTRKPAVYSSNDWVRAGGLMSYCDDRERVGQPIARYVDRILRGARPSQLPVEQPTRFILALNLKAARAIGVEFPQSLILQADEVIR